MDPQAPPLAVLGSLLFTLIGPIGLMPVFARLTEGAAFEMRLKLGSATVGIAALALGLAIWVGAPAMQKAGTSPPSLIIAAGIILLLTALRSMFGAKSGYAAPVAEPRGMAAALSPLAIPGIVTPVGVAVVIIFATYFPASRPEIFTVVVAILCANLIAMLLSSLFMRRIGMAPLMVLGSVFGVLQAAMGVELLTSGLVRSSLWP
jgi:multiple antibiotic resistance protein